MFHLRGKEQCKNQILSNITGSLRYCKTLLGNKLGLEEICFWVLPLGSSLGIFSAL